MARNVEIKARIGHVQQLLPIVTAIADSGPIHIQQDDTFFNCANGRLKLRTFSSTAGELIFYRRVNDAGPTLSTYEIAPTSAPDALRHTLELAYGKGGRVRKERYVYQIGNTRIHLDQVEDLGHFIELEVVLQDGDSVEAGVATAHALLAMLGIAPQQLVECAYVDLLRMQDEKKPREASAHGA